MNLRNLGLIWQSSLDDRPQDHSQSMVQGGSFKMCSQISSKAAKDKLYRGSTDQNPIYPIDLKRQFSCLGPNLCNIRVKTPYDCRCRQEWGLFGVGERLDLDDPDSNGPDSIRHVAQGFVLHSVPNPVVRDSVFEGVEHDVLLRYFVPHFLFAHRFEYPGLAFVEIDSTEQNPGLGLEKGSACVEGCHLSSGHLCLVRLGLGCPELVDYPENWLDH